MMDVVFEMDAGKQLVCVKQVLVYIYLHTKRQVVHFVKHVFQTIQAPVGSNLLRAAEVAEAIKLNRSDCLLWVMALLHEGALIVSRRVQKSM